MEEEAFESPERLLREVTHELAYEAVRDGIVGVPGLNNDAPRALQFANDWLERLITDGEKGWEHLRAMAAPED